MRIMLNFISTIIMIILQCDSCGEEPKGDYYDNSKRPLCRSCYEQRVASHDPLGGAGGGLPGYRKVRDCRSVHRHEFPGKEPKIIVSG